MQVEIKRRSILKGSMAAGMLGVAAGAGLLTPRMVFAAWPKSAFEAKKVDEALTNLAGNNNLSQSPDVSIRAPAIAENGAVVNVLIKTSIPTVESISILVEQNPTPLASTFDLSESMGGFIKTRVKIGKSSRVIAIVKAGGKLHSASQAVKVTLGGCGG